MILYGMGFAIMSDLFRSDLTHVLICLIMKSCRYAVSVYFSEPVTALLKVKRWMDELGFYVPSTVFQSFRDDGRVNMKGSVQ